MRKTIFILSLILFSLNVSYGQEGVTIEETDFDVDAVFENLNQEDITTGILINKVSFGSSFSESDGDCEDCTLTPVEFRQALLDLKNARFSGNEFLNDPSGSYQAHVIENKTIPIQIANILYNQFKSYAIDSNLLDTNERRFDEGSNTSESLYDTKRFVSLSIPNGLRADGLSFVVPESFYLSNDGEEVTSIEIDLGDGNGYRTVEYGETITPEYEEISEAGVEISLKITVGGVEYSAKTKTTLAICGGGNIPIPVSPPWSNSSQFQFGNTVANETNSTAGHAIGNAYVYYRDDPAPGTANKFHKPIIVVEGIDFGKYNQQNAANYQMGSFGWCALWGGSSDYAQLAKMPQLLNDYHNQGYDIIMLDFKDGATDIKENAFLLQALIEKVNQNKTSNAEPNVIIGASMGAIVARYALADMEKDGKDHCTRLYISFDGPHQGANIPIGAQYFIDFFATNNIRQIAQAKEFLNGSLSRPAARQLLKEQLKNSWETEHTQFFNTLNTLGYPQQCKNAAIVSGSSTASNLGYAPGSQIVKYDHTISSFYGLYLDGNVWATPGRSGDNLIFHGQMPWANTFKLFGRDIPISWGSVTKKVYLNSSFPHYDNAPGGIRQVSVELDRVSTKFDGKTNGDIQSLHDNQCFIPTISALDVNTTNLFFNVNLAISQGTLQTPFDEFYIPTDNTFHVEATNGTPASRGNNIQFSKSSVYQGQAVSGPVLTTTYNYGEVLNSQVTHTRVENGGKMYLYGNFADSYSNSTPPSGNTHLYYLGSNCSGRSLEIGNNGELIIGNTAVSNKATLIIGESSTIKIKSGGKVIVEDGSKLQIEEGGNFIFEDGATLELKGFGSFLVMKGKFTVGNNADFTFTGDGRIIFDQNVKWGTNSGGTPYLLLDEFWDIGQNTTFKVIGSFPQLNQNRLLLEVYKPVYFKTESGNTFKELRIENGRVALHKDALVFSFSPTILRRLVISSAYSWETHGGFRLWNNSGPNVLFDCHFEGGHPAALFHWIGSGTPIKPTACTFENNIIGIQQEGGSFELLNCDFLNNNQAILAEQLSGNSLVSNCEVIGTVNSFDNGIKASSQNGASLTIRRSKFMHTLTGYDATSLNSRVTCSEFILNRGAGIRSTDGTLDIGDDAGNFFSGNITQDILIKGNFANTAFFLNDGQNEFNARGSGQGLYIKGTITGGAPTFLNTASKLAANNNKMPLYVSSSGTIMPVNFTYTTPSNSNPIPVILDIPNNLTTTEDVCELGPDLPGGNNSPMYRSIFGIAEPGGRIQLPGGELQDLKDAALSAIAKVTFGEEENEDLDALSELTAILNAEVSAPDNATNTILAGVYHQMLVAVNNCYQYGSLEHQGNKAEPTVSTSVQGAIDAIDDILDGKNASNENDQFVIFDKNLDKAHVYRVSGLYSQTLDVLNNKDDWTFNYTQEQRAAYWKCVCTAEDDYYKGDLSQEAYLQQLTTCSEDYSEYSYKNGDVEPTNTDMEGYSVDEQVKDALQFTLYPQPTKAMLNITANQTIKETPKYEVIDMLGKTVLKATVQTNGSVYSIDVASLKPGIYSLQLTFGNQQKVLKFTKQ